MKIIAYDFDGTIYDGDSSVDFYKYCFKKKKSICKYWFKQLTYLGLYILGIKNKTQMKEVFFSYLKDFDDKESLLEEFWASHMSKLKTWYLMKNHERDIIISASPEFLLKIPSKSLNVKDLIASPVDIETGKFKGPNCHGEEKVKRLKKKYPDAVVLEMYTDSSVDLPMINIAKKGFMVRKDLVIPYDEYKPSTLSKIKHIFLTPKFLRFIFVGCINALNGILFSYLYSLLISDAVLAFVIGYATSLMISYILNSIITFKDKDFKIGKFIKFCISYIPNFLIQVACVYIFVNTLKWHRLFAYTLSAIIGIPITYLALLILPFKEKK